MTQASVAPQFWDSNVRVCLGVSTMCRQFALFACAITVCSEPRNSYAQQTSDVGYVVVSVPEAARVSVNGAPTFSTGTSRRFYSKGLVRGAICNYTVRVEVERDGERLVQTKKARGSSGRTVYLRFEFNDTDTRQTTLKPRPDEGVRWSHAKRGSDQRDFPDDGLPFEGFRWRSDERLKLNFLGVLLYITRAPKDHVSKVWFDNHRRGDRVHLADPFAVRSFL